MPPSASEMAEGPETGATLTSSSSPLPDHTATNEASVSTSLDTELASVFDSKLNPLSSVQNIKDSIAQPDEADGIKAMARDNSSSAPSLSLDSEESSLTQKVDSPSSSLSSEQHEDNNMEEDWDLVDAKPLEQNVATSAEADDDSPKSPAGENTENENVAINQKRPVHDDTSPSVKEATAPLDFQERRRLEQQKALEDSNNEVTPNLDPLDMLRKGAVAAVGGTMVGIGLVMIPLPTPFGAVVASSGMAVLGTEFQGAKELNNKLIDQTKTHLESARERVIQSIESMEDDGKRQMKGDDGDSDDDDSAIVVVRDGEDSTNHSVRSNNSKDSGAEESKPKALCFMNPAERQRQIERQRQQREAKKNEVYGMMRMKAGAYLSKNLLPILKRHPENKSSEPQAETKEIQDMEISFENGAEVRSV